MLTLTKDDLVQICGIADGVRMNNALQLKKPRAKLTIYVSINAESGNYLLARCFVPLYIFLYVTLYVVAL